MESLNTQEIWRRIPLEEKFELIAQAHAKGLSAVLIFLTVTTTIGVGLTLTYLIWVSCLITPLIFQWASGKAWKGMKPRIILEYLAARSAARRYAFAINGRDLSLSLMFRGTVRFDGEEDPSEGMFGSLTHSAPEQLVWVALFADSVVMMSEGVKGADLVFSHLLDDKLIVEVTEGNPNTPYTSNREIAFVSRAKGSLEGKKLLLKSKYPAALVVFERRVVATLEVARRESGKKPEVDPIDRNNGFERWTSGN